MKSKKMNKGVKLYNRKSNMIADLYTCKNAKVIPLHGFLMGAASAMDVGWL